MTLLPLSGLPDSGLPDSDFSEPGPVDELDRSALEPSDHDAAYAGRPDTDQPGVDEPDGEGERTSHLRVAPKVSREVLRRRRLARLAVLGVAAISAASMFLLVAFHVFAVQSSFQLDKLNSQLTAEQRQYERLRNEVATRSSPAAIAKAAAAMGMVRSPDVTMLHAPKTASFGSNASLPVPPTLPYSAIVAGP